MLSHTHVTRQLRDRRHHEILATLATLEIQEIQEMSRLAEAILPVFTIVAGRHLPSLRYMVIQHQTQERCSYVTRETRGIKEIREIETQETCETLETLEIQETRVTS